MSDIIHLLPDSIANQIAAGEVIQRPSSVIKELVENAIDAGASRIQIIVKDAGRTLIQVIDDGKGMSATDARMSFERHATSKIKSADDLFSLRTMGFRGEALASIAAISQVELRTRREEDELGTLISISGSTLEEQSSISCPRGCNFSVKNLFFNVPARRKFLKGNSTELKHVISDFHRIALIYPEIEFEFYHNDNEVHILRTSSYRQRILNIFGKNLNLQLLDIKESNDMIKIHGFVGKPESARKQGALSYFFVNGRYMNHPYFHRAVMQAYDKMLPSETKPNYFIYFEVDPATIDVNVHPTKTEIKFENESAIWSILMASVKESLGKFNMLPPMNFEDEMENINNFIPSNETVSAPKVDIKPDYNPFKSNNNTNYNRPSLNWEKLYEGFENKGIDNKTTKIEKEEYLLPSSNLAKEEKQSSIDYENDFRSLDLFQLQKKYILTSVESGVMLIDQHRAHLRILFEQHLSMIEHKRGSSQSLLFPEILEINPADVAILRKIQDDLYYVGFDLSDFGKNAFQINAVPTNLEGINATDIIQQMIDTEKNKSLDVKSDLHEMVALSLAKSMAIKQGQSLNSDEMNQLVNQLFATSNPNYSPEGKLIISILTNDEIEKKFK
jgi:DNA mismatch repair protein MutL